uniref:Uncharacterized protein n=1 Tax=Oryza brachyantha TaxID=4533 RepID=J3LU29_ORYBR
LTFKYFQKSLIWLIHGFLMVFTYVKYRAQHLFMVLLFYQCCNTLYKCCLLNILYPCSC